MAPEQQRYLAYMLRLWQMGQDRRAWRASLENAHTGARHGFASLDALFAFLEENTDRGPCAVAGESRSGSGESQGQESEPYSSEENAALGGKDAKRPHQP
jgi:hypothetical protein